jgi:ComF family protein
MQVRALVDALLTVLVAAPCVACGHGLEQPSRGPVCPACWGAIPPIIPPVCERCGDPLPAWRTISLPADECARCRRMNRAIDAARAGGVYAGTLRAVVHALKYDGRRSLAVPLGGLMCERGAGMIAGAAAVIPVPLHPQRRRQRGFNQAADLAKQIGLPVIHALRRVRATADQVELPAAKRHANVRGAFEAAAPAFALARCAVLLVDDVSTTGATLDACALVLKKAGIREVRALTAARTVAGQAPPFSTGLGEPAEGALRNR